MRFLLKGGLVIDPQTGLEKEGDIRVAEENGNGNEFGSRRRGVN